MASSSSNLWATASKEWVIQPKPKPGRKPKKDPVATVKEDTEVDAKGRRFQNRAAQRAFRERKQSQLSELQARIQSYEQGEIERNVALQNIAKRLKEENEKLRQENLALQSKLAQALAPTEQPRNQHVSQVVDKKRWRDESPSSILSVQPSAKKKSRKTLEPDSKIQTSNLTVSHLPSPSSMVSSPESFDTADSHFSPHPYDAPSDMDNNAFDTFGHLSSDGKGGSDVLGSFTSFGCGFCDGGTLCVCQEIAVHDVVDRSLGTTEFKDNEFNDAHVLHMRTEDTPETSVDIEQPSILNNLPAYQPPVPLRRRVGGVPVNSIFPVAMRDTTSVLDANCSGDPSNCLACGDDAFGKAFCDAIGNTAATQTCDSCPNSTATSQCCGNGSTCSGSCSVSRSKTLDAMQHPDASNDLIPTNDAWQKLKAHPNVEFADLSLLAEVVASRSNCLGPALVVGPTTQNQRAHDTGAHAFNHEQLYNQQPRKHSPPPRLVPQEILLECGRRRFRHVHADGVREALRMLDAKFS